MDLVDVDVIGAQPPQPIVDLAHDPRAARIAKRLAVAPVDACFRSDQRAIAQARLGQGLAYDFFSVAETIDWGRVDDIDAMLQRGPDGRYRFSVIGAAPHPAADGPSSKCNARDLKRCFGVSGLLHVRPPCSSRRCPSDGS